MSCSEWRIISFEESGLEIEDGDRGKNYPKKSELLPTGYCPFLNNKNVINDKITLDDVEFITKEKDEILRKGKIKVNDIVLTTRGSVGNVGLFHSGLRYKHARINSGMVIIRNNNDIFNLKYLYQLLKSPLMKNQYKSMSTGTAQPQLPIKDIKKLELIVPPLEEQEKIANILSSLDDKIELNNDMNKTLEEMAQSIFKRWFVDFEFPNEDGEPYKSSGGEMVDSELGMIPKGWEVNNLESYVTFSQGIQVPVKKQSEIKNDGFVRFLRIVDYTNNDSDLPRYVEDKGERYYCNKKEVAMVRYGNSCGFVCRRLEGILANNLFKINPCDPLGYNYIYYLLNMNSIQEYIISSSIGSAMPALNHGIIGNIKLVIPEKYMIDVFENICDEIEEQICSNRENNKYLSDLRDILLPKLMSGEIRVK